MHNIESKSPHIVHFEVLVEDNKLFIECPNELLLES